jgi:nucleotide-binding universal stress UspA family protein
VSEIYKPIYVERILVPLDNSTHSFAALKAAVEMANHYGAELRGVFIEDITLLNLAQMPFHQEVGEYSAIIREISFDGLNRGIFVQSRWVIQSFRKLTNQTDIKAEFTVLRGDVNKMIDKESQTCDLIIIGKSGKNILGRSRLGSTAKMMVQKHQNPLLLVEENNQLGYPMILLYENSPEGKISLETARDLLDPEETLVILLNKDDPELFLETTSQLNKWASMYQINISIQGFKTHSLERYIHMIMKLKTGLFILPHITDPVNQTIAQVCLEKISLPVMLIRVINNQ